jgi:RNA polymerase sigma-70 factor (ECF subfamily)
MGERELAAELPMERGAEPYEEWMARIARGDSAAFEALFRAMYDQLCEFAEGYVRSSHAAEEIVDDVFLKLWAERDRRAVRGSVKSYLYVAVRNHALNHIARRKVEQRYSDRVLQLEGPMWQSGISHVEDEFYSQELATQVREAIDELPERARQTYLLYYRDHLSYAEVAAIMGVSVKTVENQLARALKILWSRLGHLVE